MIILTVTVVLWLIVGKLILIAGDHRIRRFNG